jgi:hypothetical protein
LVVVVADPKQSVEFGVRSQLQEEFTISSHAKKDWPLFRDLRHSFVRPLWLDFDAKVLPCTDVSV